MPLPMAGTDSTRVVLTTEFAFFVYSLNEHWCCYVGSHLKFDTGCGIADMEVYTTAHPETGALFVGRVVLLGAFLRDKYVAEWRDFRLFVQWCRTIRCQPSATSTTRNGLGWTASPLNWREWMALASHDNNPVMNGLAGAVCAGLSRTLEGFEFRQSFVGDPNELRFSFDSNELSFQRQ